MAIDFAGTAQIIAGSNTALSITASGEITSSSAQPVFSATSNTTSSSLTPVYNTWTVFNNFSGWGTTRWISDTNVGNCLNTANGRFTTVTAGYYLFSATTCVNVGYSFYTTFFLNNAYQPPYTLDYEYNAAASGYTCYRTPRLTVIRYMSVGDTLELGGYFSSSTYSPTLYAKGGIGFMGLLLG
jgi:hypothetical protein